MAQKAITVTTDDLTGEDITGTGETIRFQVNGQAYVIDLSKENADAFMAALEPYITAARPDVDMPAAKARRGTKGNGRTGKGRTIEARRWARQHGVLVSERGRLPAEIMAAYEAGDPSMLPGYRMTPALREDQGEDLAPVQPGDMRTETGEAVREAVSEMRPGVAAPAEPSKSRPRSPRRRKAANDTGGGETEAELETAAAVAAEGLAEFDQWAPSRSDDERAAAAKVRGWLQAVDGKAPKGRIGAADKMRYAQFYELHAPTGVGA